MTSNSIKFENSSFRDNLGNVFYLNGKILRTITKEGKKNYEFLKLSGILENSITDEFLISTSEINKKNLPNFFTKFDYVLESKLIPFISYPYEWTFDQLKRAALHLSSALKIDKIEAYQMILEKMTEILQENN